MTSTFGENTTRRFNLIALTAGLAFLLIYPAGSAAQTIAAGEGSWGNVLEIAGVWDSLEDESQPFEKTLDRVFKVNHFVRYAPGKKLFVTEYFTIRSLLRRPRRAVVFLTGPEFRGNFLDIPVEGYSGPAMAAQHGFLAYTLDYVGVGESHHPENGSQINYLTNAAAVRPIINKIRRSRGVAKVDLVGEHYGGEIAAVLAKEMPNKIRSVVMSTMNYRAISPVIVASFLTPELEAFLRSEPDGYWEPDLLELTLMFSPNEELRDYAFATQNGTYPTGPFLQFYDIGLPVIDAFAQQVPLLLIAGELDVFLVPGDMERLAVDWGGGATLVVIPEAHKAPRIETEEIAGRFFQEIFDFLDP